MKYLICSDNHFSEKSSVLLKRGELFSSRLENQIKSLDWVNSFNLPVIHLGDFFDRDLLNSEEISCFSTIKAHIDFSNWKFLQGNHGYSRGYDVMGIFDCNIINTPRVESLGNLKCGWLPFKSTKTDLEDLKGCDLLLGHIGIENLPFGARGFDRNEVSNSCKLFLNGHLHNRQKFAENCYNVGSLTALNFSDNCYNAEKGIYILDTETLNLEFIENPYAFNFYKIHWADLESGKISLENKSKILRETSCVSVFCKNGDKSKIIDSEIFKNNYYFRITEESKAEAFAESIKTPASLDYLEKFRTSFIEKYGESQVAFEELSEVLQ